MPHSERSLTSVRFLMRPNWLSTTPAQKKPRIGLALTTRKAGTTSTVTPRKVSVSNPRSLITSTAVAISTPPAAARTRNNPAAPRRRPIIVLAAVSPRRSRDGAEHAFLLLLLPRRGGCSRDADTEGGSGVIIRQRQRAGKRAPWAPAAAAAMAPEQTPAASLRAYVRGRGEHPTAVRSCCCRRRRGRTASWNAGRPEIWEDKVEEDDGEAGGAPRGRGLLRLSLSLFPVSITNLPCYAPFCSLYIKNQGFLLHLLHPTIVQNHLFNILTESVRKFYSYCTKPLYKNRPFCLLLAELVRKYYSYCTKSIS